MNGPTAQHWRAVHDAIAKITGRGQWSYLPAHTLPSFFIRWDDKGMDPRAESELAVFPDYVVICLRSSTSPEATHRACLHELGHASDLDLIRANFPVTKLEYRACALEGRLAPL